MFDPDYDCAPLSEHRIGGLVIRKDDGKTEIIVEPVVDAFVPVRSNVRCICGAPLEPWSLQSLTADTAQLVCSACHRVLGRIRGANLLVTSCSRVPP